jgi:hypothetical protein
MLPNVSLYKDDESVTVDVAHFAPGFYFATMISTDGGKQVAKISKE